MINTNNSKSRHLYSISWKQVSPSHIYFTITIFNLLIISSVKVLPGSHFFLLKQIRVSLPLQFMVVESFLSQWEVKWLVQGHRASTQWTLEPGSLGSLSTMLSLPLSKQSADKDLRSNLASDAWPWTNYFTSLSLSFFICKIGIIVGPTS